MPLTTAFGACSAERETNAVAAPQIVRQRQADVQLVQLEIWQVGIQLVTSSIAAQTLTAAALDGKRLAQLLGATTTNSMNVAVSFSDSDYGREAAASFYDEFTAVYNQFVTVSIQHQIGKTEYSAELATLAAAGGDVLVIFADFATSAEGLIRAGVETGGFDDFVLGSEAYSPSLPTLLGIDDTALGARSFDCPHGPQNLTGYYLVKESIFAATKLLISGQDATFKLREGTDGNNLRIGGAEADVIAAYAGTDTLYGGSGSDYLSGGSGADRLRGGPGRDTVSGGLDDDTAFGGDGADRLFGDEGNDLLLGELDHDRLYGGVGDDTLNGGLGRDRLFGEEGSDRLRGGGGTDYLDGGAGNDFLRGGLGADVFVFNVGSANDHIVDFQWAEHDVIRLDDALWAGDLTEAEVIAEFGTVVDGNILLTFANGELLQIDGIANLARLSAFIDII
jgi:Ca2+-binding RTX toxin-like protein